MEKRISLTFDKSQTELDVPMEDLGITYNRFIIPKGYFAEGKDIGGAFFFPYTARVDEENQNKVIASFPASFKIELCKIIWDKDGTYLDMEKTVLSAQALSDILKGVPQKQEQTQKAASRKPEKQMQVEKQKQKEKGEELEL